MWIRSETGIFLIIYKKQTNKKFCNLPDLPRSYQLYCQTCSSCRFLDDVNWASLERLRKMISYHYWLYLNSWIMDYILHIWENYHQICAYHVLLTLLEVFLGFRNRSIARSVSRNWVPVADMSIRFADAFITRNKCVKEVIAMTQDGNRSCKLRSRQFLIC